MTENISKNETVDIRHFKAVAFDAFGTVVHIPGYRKPYRQLITYLKSHGVSIQPTDADRLMANKVELSEVGPHFGFTIPEEILALAEMDLQYDLNSTILFEDTLRTISRLQANGTKVAICSNLASPYSAPVKQLLPELDVYVWSYEARAVKPDPKIYAYLCRQLDCLPEQVLMVGDTLEADYYGPRRFGMQSLYLSRISESKAQASLHSLDDMFK